MDLKTFITSEPTIHHGEVCIRNTRIPVTVVLDNLKAGLTLDEIVKSYPSLTIKVIKAIITYAAETNDCY